MKKAILTFVLCLSCAGGSFAQNNIEGMRFLTITAMVQYGQKLYERGDFNEACAVFNHVLTYDAHQAQALEYLKEMGHAPAVIEGVAAPVSSQSPIQFQFQPVKPVVVGKDKIVIADIDASTLTTVDVLDTGSLKKAIEAKKQVIEKLRSQITQIRADLASQTAQAAKGY